MKPFPGVVLSSCLVLTAFGWILGPKVRADIAPTRFVGAGIAPQGNTNIRMERAVVEIIWGTPCTLEATFTMVNRSAAAQAVMVGFPMPAGESLDGRPPDPLSISFDGEAAVVAGAEASVDDQDREGEWRWYRCQHTFQPGTTRVVVKTTLRASRVGGGAYQESLRYCIETGGNWAGTIGEEVVTIRFPEALARDQVIAAKPGGYTIEGGTLRWRFADIEPVGKEYDIALTYVRPDAMRVITTLRDELKKSPESSAAAIKLSQNLLVLGWAKSNSGFPPQKLSREDFEALSVRISSEDDRAIFSAHYRLGKSGAYEAETTEWTPGRNRVIQILADAGYRDESSKNVFVLEGEELLKATLRRDPHNAVAWNVYLANYWRFSFAAVGHWFGQTRLGRGQIEAIETAAKNCPADEVIGLWRALVRAAPERRDFKPVAEAISRRDFLRTDFPRVNYDYY